jgi:hypothetical protein
VARHTTLPMPSPRGIIQSDGLKDVRMIEMPNNETDQLETPVRMIEMPNNETDQDEAKATGRKPVYPQKWKSLCWIVTALAEDLVQAV